MSESGYYQQLLEITKVYLGPAAERFLNRQIATHLRKEPTSLEKSDIPMLAIRIRSGLKVLSHDEKVAEEAYQRLAAIADS